MFQTKVVDKPKTHFIFSNTFFENRAMLSKVEKYSTIGKATDDNMFYSHCVLDT